MRIVWLVLLLLIVPNIVWSRTAPAAQERVSQDSFLIKRIVLSGFVLKDKQPIQRIIKANRNKRLSQEQIQQMINDIKIIYLEAGYTGLVNFSYTIQKRTLTIHILLLDR